MLLKLGVACFNPRARDGREGYAVIPANTFEVSIHAPVMDAKAVAILASIITSFNPRARDGREIRG